MGEDAATLHLVRHHVIIVERNWTCRIGEVDIIGIDETAGADDRSLVFVEVKTRISSPLAERHLFDTLTLAKQRRLRMLAEMFLRYRPQLLPGRRNAHGIRSMRIDVIGVIFENARGNVSSIKHLRAAV